MTATRAHSRLPNIEMRQAILELAARFGGMAPAELKERDLGTAHAVNQCALRMAKRGELHAGDNGVPGAGGKRRIRYFTDVDHRDFWVKQQTEAKHMPVSPPTQPASWGPQGAALAGTNAAAGTSTTPPTSQRTRSTQGLITTHTPRPKRLRSDATVQGLDTAPVHRADSRMAAHLMSGKSLRARAPTDLPFVPRPGSMDYAQHPTRIGNELRYPDGRVEHMQPAQTSASGTTTASNATATA